MDLTRHTLDLKRLRTFVAVVEEGGFARAAARLALAQPAVSRQIGDLEDRLGCTLVERGRGGISLTAAGDGLLEGARRLLEETAGLEGRVRALGRGEHGTLTLGFNETVSWGSVIPSSAAAFRSRYPGVTLVLEPLHSIRQIEALHEGRLDGGFLFHRDPGDDRLEGMVVMEDSLLLALPPGSRWADTPPDRLSDLHDEAFVWIPRALAPPYHDRVLDCCQAAGLRPRIVQEAMDGSGLLGLVAVGMGLTFVPAAARLRCPREVTLIPVRDLDLTLHLELVWRRDRQSATLARFRELVAEEASPRA